MQKKYSTRSFVFAGLLIALEILLTRFAQIPLQFLEISKDRISLGFLPVSVGGMLFGPFFGGLIAALADILRAILLPQGGAINPLYTVSAFLRGVLYGAFLYKNTSWKRIFLVSVLIYVFINVGLNTAITAFSYGASVAAWGVQKIIATTINFLIQITVLPLILPKLERSLNFHA